MTRTPRTRAAVPPLLLALALGACGGDEDSSSATASSSPASSASSADPDVSPSGAAGASPSGDPSASGTPPSPSPTGTGDGAAAGGQADPSPETVPTALDTDVFSGYQDVSRGVVAWEPLCPRDFGPEGVGVTPSAAVAMGTASDQLEPEGVIARSGRQVAVFGSVDDAVAAADALGAYVRSCAETYEPMPGFVTWRGAVGTSPVGAQGVLLDVVREDGDDTFVFFRRGTAVGLVSSSGIDYPEGRSSEGDATAGAQDLFRQMCTYERGAC